MAAGIQSTVLSVRSWHSSPPLPMGKAVRSRFELNDRETTIGRHPECSIVVDAGAVSRYHAKVVRKPNGFPNRGLGKPQRDVS